VLAEAPRAALDPREMSSPFAWRQATLMPIAIAGMHRSGTSMVAQFLHRCGVFLGPASNLMEAAEQNPEGFWEHVQLVEINDELLNLLGAGWDYPPRPPIDWDSPRFDHLRTRAARVFAEFEQYERWGWKDPRTSLTLPFWRAVVGGIQVVAVVRNPLEVALSLRHRNGFSLALGLALWQATYRHLLADTTPEQRILTHYDAYFGRPAAEFERLLRFLDLPGEPAVIAELAQTTRTTRLRHHRLTARDLVEADVATEVLDLYAVLCREAEWADEGFTETPLLPEDAPRNDLVPHDTGQPVPWDFFVGTTVVPGIGQTNRFLVELEKVRWDLSEYKRSAINRQARLDELEGGIVEREYKLRERDMRLQVLINVVKQRDATVAELTAERDTMAQTLRDLETQTQNGAASRTD
jgi:hypothetical protein